MLYRLSYTSDRRLEARLYAPGVKSFRLRSARRAVRSGFPAAGRLALAMRRRAGNIVADREASCSVHAVSV
ncbi:MAG: hypothetical protein RML56_13960 [Burkholderiales bacterium]|nr:hypothetical protein [Burkholderiales bacterium]